MGIPARAKLRVIIPGVLCGLFSIEGISDQPGSVPDPVVIQIGQELIKESEITLGKIQLRLENLQLNCVDVVSLVKKRKQLALEARTRASFKVEEFAVDYQKLITQGRESKALQRDVENRLIVEAYQRSRFMIKASQIIIGLSSNPAELEIQQAWNRAFLIRQKYQSKEQSFEQLAVSYSDDPSATFNGGRMDYFTVFEKLYPVETAAYQTPIGAVSTPVKTRFGIHLLKVEDRIRLPGRKRVSQIMIRTSPSDSQPQMSETVQRINQVYQMTSTKPFSELVSQFSEDVKSKLIHGDLGFDRLINELESVRLSLDRGEVSRPTRSPQGWHILKLTEILEFPSFEKSESLLRERIGLDARVDRILRPAKIPEQNYRVLNDLYASYENQLLSAKLLAEIFPSSKANSSQSVLSVICSNSRSIGQLNLDRRFPVQTSPSPH